MPARTVNNGHRVTVARRDFRISGLGSAPNAEGTCRRCRGLVSCLLLWMAIGRSTVVGTAEMHSLKLDPVTVCRAALEAMRTAFASAGLASDYGGPHANDVTHMALIGFEDGSYLELIAPQKPGVVAGADWAKFMEGD